MHKPAVELKPLRITSTTYRSSSMVPSLNLDTSVQARPILVLIDDLRERGRGTLRLLILIKFLAAQPLALESLGIRVETQQHLTIAQRVLLLHTSPFSCTLALLRTNHRLHLGAVYQACDVRVRDQIGRQQEILLESTWSSGATIDGIQCGECTRRPHDEATQMSTGRQLQEVQSEDTAGFHTRDISECLDEFLSVFFGVVDNQWSPTLAMATIAEFSFTGVYFALTPVGRYTSPAKAIQGCALPHHTAGET